MGSPMDLLDLIGEDAAAEAIAALDDPADLLRASSISKSWNQFVIRNGLVKKLCERMCPELTVFPNVNKKSIRTEWETLKIEHRVYSYLSQCLVSCQEQEDCILKAIAASSTDNYPDESIQNTLEPSDRGQTRPSFWSSEGETDPNVPANLTYRLKSGLCIVNEIQVHPFKAFFQFGHPIYSAKSVRFRLGYSKIGQETASDEDDVLAGRSYTDDNYIWTYVSPEFPMLQEDRLQSFKLPRPVICTGGIVQIELLRRAQRHELDRLFYFGVRHVKMIGFNLSPVFGCDNLHDITRGPALKYFTDAKAHTRSELREYKARAQHTSHQSFTTRLRKLRYNGAIFSRFFEYIQQCTNNLR